MTPSCIEPPRDLAVPAHSPIGRDKWPDDSREAIAFAEPWASLHNAQLWGSSQQPAANPND